MPTLTLHFDPGGGPLVARPSAGQAARGSYSVLLVEHDGLTLVRPSPWDAQFGAPGDNIHVLPGTAAANDGRVLDLVASVGLMDAARAYAVHLAVAQDGVTLGTASDVGTDAGAGDTHESTLLVVLSGKPALAAASAPAEQVLAGVRWRRLTGRAGTRGPLSARFAAARVVAADGTQTATGQHRPGEAVWVVGERRDSGEAKYYLSNVGPNATLRQLAGAIKARWACEQAHQQLKAELGLDHFEGRTWAGLHHHALLSLISFAFLQHLRLTEARGRGENRDLARPSPRPAARAVAAGDPARAARPARRRAPTMPHVPRAADVSAARAAVDVAE